jgi:hypothetical protein
LKLLPWLLEQVAQVAQVLVRRDRLAEFLRFCLLPTAAAAVLIGIPLEMLVVQAVVALTCRRAVEQTKRQASVITVALAAVLSMLAAAAVLEVLEVLELGELAGVLALRVRRLLTPLVAGLTRNP